MKNLVEGVESERKKMFDERVVDSAEFGRGGGGPGQTDRLKGKSKNLLKRMRGL